MIITKKIKLIVDGDKKSRSGIDVFVNLGGRILAKNLSLLMFG